MDQQNKLSISNPEIHAALSWIHHMKDITSQLLSTERIPVYDTIIFALEYVLIENKIKTKTIQEMFNEINGLDREWEKLTNSECNERIDECVDFVIKGLYKISLNEKEAIENVGNHES